MNKKGILILSITGLLLLSGCIENINSQKTPTITPTITSIATPTMKQPSNITPIATVKSTITDNLSTNNKIETVLNASSWCKPGAGILKAGKGLTIRGLVTDDNGTSLCYATLSQLKNGTNTTMNYYFNEDKTIEKMNSTSTSPTGNASASSKSIVKISVGK